jgi:hypothetical protein
MAAKKKPDPIPPIVDPEFVFVGLGVQLDTAGVGALLGIDPASVRRYMVADRDRYGFPAPDGRIGRSPWWWASTIEAWVAGRPGQGAGAGRPRKVAEPVKAAPVKRARARKGGKP